MHARGGGGGMAVEFKCNSIEKLEGDANEYPLIICEPVPELMRTCSKICHHPRKKKYLLFIVIQDLG